MAAMWLIWRKVPQVRNWPSDSLRNWVRYALWKGRMVVLYDKRQKAVAVGAARCVKGEPVFDWYSHEPGGDTVMIDMVVGTDLMGKLWDVLLKRFGKRKWVVFTRVNDITDRPRKYEFEKLNRKIYGK